MFEGFITDALRYLLGRDDDAKIACDEVHCVAQGVHERCRFESNTISPT